MQINPEIFRSYDIRGIAGKDLNREVAEKIGRSFGSYIQDLDECEEQYVPKFIID